MRISYNHIIKYFNSKIKIEDISEKLYQLGHENEIEDNKILNIEFTPNRGDCLSVEGIVRDLNVFYETEMHKEIYDEQIDKFDLEFKNNSVSSCPNISFLKLTTDSEIANYNYDMTTYFHDLDYKKNNFFSDVSNYVSYETGQPTHCYDLNKINGQITLKEIDIEKKFKTLIGKEIQLSGKNLVFCSNDDVINLAGVMGGDSTSCDNLTREVLIECATFVPEAIIGKSLKYDLQSDAAYKFERGVDPLCHDRVLRRFINIVQEHTNIRNVELFSKGYKDIKTKEIKFDHERISKILGTNIDSYLYQNILFKLGFNIINDYIKIPSYRTDVETQNDLAEEVARVIGYDNITPSEIKIPKNSSFQKQCKEKILKDILIDNGFYEVINDPFVSKENINAIKVDNPLDSKKNSLRSSLKESLIENLLYNERRQKDSIKLFEISDVFSSEKNLVTQRNLGIIASGRVGNNHVDFSKKIDQDFLLKILNQFGITDINAFDVIPRNELDSKIKSEIVYFELCIDKMPALEEDYKSIAKLPSEYIRYEPVSDFPSSKRDLSFLIEDFSALSTLKDKIQKYQHEHLKDIFIFDLYENKNKSQIKIGFRFTFQSRAKTLTEDEINLIMDNIIDNALKIEAISIPGLDR